MHSPSVLLLALSLAATTEAAQVSQAPSDRAGWIAMKDAGFPVPKGTRAADMLIEMNVLLASPDPVLRDEVAYSAAERWILRDRLLTPDDLRTVRDLWLANLQDGLGSAGDGRAFKRSFSALCLSLVAAADLRNPFLSDAEYTRFFDAMVDYLDRERDLRGFDATRGWCHAVAHTADALRFLTRNSRFDAERAARVLGAMSRKLRSVDEVFRWGEADRIAQALVPVARAQPDLFAAWLQPWVSDARHLWANGPQVDPREFARVENVKQTLRSLYAALQVAASIASATDPRSADGSRAVLDVLARMQ